MTDLAVAPAASTLSGLLAGLLHARLLARAAAGRTGGAGLLVRLGLVGVVLLLSASAQHLLAAILGWASGLTLAVGVIARYWPVRDQPWRTG